MRKPPKDEAVIEAEKRRKAILTLLGRYRYASPQGELTEEEIQTTKQADPPAKDKPAPNRIKRLINLEED